MITQIKHFIGETEIRPENANTIGLKFDFSGDPKEAELSTDRIVLSQNAYRLVQAHKASIGLFEGVPYRVVIGTVEIQYFIDLTENPMFTDSNVEVSIKRRFAVDWFVQQARGLTFDSLNSQVPITGIFDVPYVIVKDNQLELLIMLSITTYSLTKESIQAVRDLVDIITAPTIEATTPGVSPAGPVVNVGSIIALAIRIAAQIVYTVAITIALINLIKQMAELIVPKVRYLKASKMKELLRQGCQHLGKQFSSTLLDSIPQATILPVPMLESNPSIVDVLLGNQSTYFNKGYPSSLDSCQTLWELFEECKKIFNAKVRIIGDTVHFERRDYWYTQSGATIVRTMNDQEKRQRVYEYNFSDTFKRYYIHYDYDLADTFTRDRIQGLRAEYETRPINVVNTDLVTIKNLAEVPINLSLAARKNALNFAEKRLLTLANFADNLVNTFGGNSNLSGLIEGRIGVMQISEQHFTKTKFMYTVGGKQPANYVDHIGATALWNKYHIINNVKDNFKTIEKATIPFTEKQLQQLLNNNVIEDQNGNQLEILTFDTVIDTSTANIEFLQKSEDANNLTTVKIL